MIPHGVVEPVLDLIAHTATSMELRRDEAAIDTTLTPRMEFKMTSSVFVNLMHFDCLGGRELRLP